MSDITRFVSHDVNLILPYRCRKVVLHYIFLVIFEKTKFYKVMTMICSWLNIEACTADKDAQEMGNTAPGRYIQCFVYVRASPNDNFYAHPLDIVVVVELQAKRVLHFWHHKGHPIIPTLNSNFHQELVEQVGLVQYSL